MSQSLPTDGFRWLNNDEIQELFTKLKDVPEDGAKGYILEVDLEIPLDKHDYFNQYVPAPSSGIGGDAGKFHPFVLSKMLHE